MLKADRSTLFLNDEKTNELWSQVGTGLDAIQIRLPNHLGIAGAVFTSGKTINIPYAYADLRFNPAFDKKTGYFTRSILCVPVVNKDGKVIGVTQVLNKRGGPFNEEDEVAAEGVHRPGVDRAAERQALRRRPEHEELQREHARKHVERRRHHQRGRADRHLQQGRLPHHAGEAGRHHRQALRRVLRRRERLGRRQDQGGRGGEHLVRDDGRGDGVRAARRSPSTSPSSR